MEYKTAGGYMNKNEIVKRVQAGEGLTVAEIKAYQETVKQETPVYGRYGTLRKRFLEEKGVEWTIANLPKYLHNVDKQANEMYETMYAKLSNMEQFKKTGNFQRDLQIKTEIHHRIEEEILNEIVYA